MGFIDWITAALLLVSPFLVVLIYASNSYHEYIKSLDRRRLLRSIIHLAPISIAVLILLAVIFPSLGSLLLTSSLALIPFFVLVEVYRVLAERKSKCSKEERVSTGGLDFVVCRDGPLNAWYDYGKKKIYISDKLLKILTDEELKAVYYHEEGHRNYGYLARTSLYIRWVWFIFFSLAFTVLIDTEFKIIIINATLWDYSLLLLFLVSITASISAISIVWNWINEHESDVYSAGKVGAKPLISALAKLYLYGLLEKNGIPAYYARVSIDLDVESITRDPRKMRFTQIFTLLLKRSLHSALGVIRPTSIYEAPIPDTHPPLEYRVLVIWGMHATY
jgi:Zn-dependent protease with chaperone function